MVDETQPESQRDEAQGAEEQAQKAEKEVAIIREVVVREGNSSCWKLAGVVGLVVVGLPMLVVLIQTSAQLVARIF